MGLKGILLKQACPSKNKRHEPEENPPPHLQTQCTHHGFGSDSFEAGLPEHKIQAGGLGGAQPPPFAKTMPASWVWKGFV